MNFYEWWVLEFGLPPSPEQGELFEHCLSAFREGREDTAFESHDALVDLANRIPTMMNEQSLCKVPIPPNPAMCSQ